MSKSVNRNMLTKTAALLWLCFYVGGILMSTFFVTPVAATAWRISIQIHTDLSVGQDMRIKYLEFTKDGYTVISDSESKFILYAALYIYDYYCSCIPDCFKMEYQCPAGVVPGEYDWFVYSDMVYNPFRGWFVVPTPTSPGGGQTHYAGEGHLSYLENEACIYFGKTEQPVVGGVSVPVDKFGLLAPYIGLASTILVATAATAIYVKRAKPRKEKQ